jgi:monoamine oxidase
MIQTDILIIGAGASGLAAGYELSLVNKKVAVLEARDRIGGRIHSIEDERFKQIVETGAEFIHGKLPVTFNLLNKAKIKYHSAEGKIWEVENGEICRKKDFITGWGKLMKQLSSLKKDIPFSEFLNTNFLAEEDKELKESALKFVQGYNAADAAKASSLALLDEWENQDDDHQGRIDNGYAALMNFLADKIKKRASEIFTAAVVKTIKWQKGKAEVITSDDRKFLASKVLITIPLGVWQAEGDIGSISFLPELLEKKQSAKKMGFGAVIKINLQFQDNFWEERVTNKMKDAGFIFSDAEIPTWWTQEPIKNGMLTGWLAGPKAMELKEAREEELFEKTLQVLAYIFGVEKDLIKKELVAHYITNWTADKFSRGAYSYSTLDTNWAKDVLLKPVEETLYFAGEALYKGSETGTVEGALASGIEAARKIISLSQYG